jgi:hypothetical protein
MKRIGTQVIWMPTLTLGCHVLVRRCRRTSWMRVPDFVVMVCTILRKLERTFLIQACRNSSLQTRVVSSDQTTSSVCCVQDTKFQIFMSFLTDAALEATYISCGSWEQGKSLIGHCNCFQTPQSCFSAVLSDHSKVASSQPVGYRYIRCRGLNMCPPVTPAPGYLVPIIELAFREFRDQTWVLQDVVAKREGLYSETSPYSDNWGVEVRVRPSGLQACIFQGVLACEAEITSQSRRFRSYAARGGIAGSSLADRHGNR